MAAITPVQVMALAVVFLILLKLIFALISPRKWFKVTNIIYSTPVITTVLGLTIAGITLYFLLKEITLVQIFAVILFLMAMMLVGFAPYTDEMLDLSKKILGTENREGMKKSWFPILAWLVLVAWVIFLVVKAFLIS